MELVGSKAGARLSKSTPPSLHKPQLIKHKKKQSSEQILPEISKQNLNTQESTVVQAGKLKAALAKSATQTPAFPLFYILKLSVFLSSAMPQRAISIAPTTRAHRSKRTAPSVHNPQRIGQVKITKANTKLARIQKQTFE